MKLSSILGRVTLFYHKRPVKICLPNSNNRSISIVDFIKESCPSLYGPKAIYRPTFYLFNKHLQTCYSAYNNKLPTTTPVHYERELVDMPDGGQVALDWSPSKESAHETPTLVVLHGLTGGSHESYIRCLLEVITHPPFNYRAVVLNCRGCANSEIKTPQMYNGGYTNDLRFILAHIQKTLAPHTPLVGIGYSLGSNILVKYLGEEGEKVPLKAAISVANPFDFRSSMDRLNETLIGRIYSFAMARNLIKTFSKHLHVLIKSGKIEPDAILAAKTIREFDDACTRKMFDYTTVNNYYRDASSCRFIEHVKIPLLCLNALDDPIANAASIPFDEIKINPHVVLATTAYGGHLGWFENFNKPTRWMVKPLSEFIIAMFQAVDIRQIQGEKLDANTINEQVEKVQGQAGPHEIA